MIQFFHHFLIYTNCYFIHFRVIHCDSSLYDCGKGIPEVIRHVGVVCHG